MLQAYKKDHLQNKLAHTQVPSCYERGGNIAAKPEHISNKPAQVKLPLLRKEQSWFQLGDIGKVMEFISNSVTKKKKGITSALLSPT